MDGLDEIVGEFLVESHENLDQLDRDLVALEQEPDSRALLGSIFRTIHTIKGTSGFLGYARLESVTHVGESLLSRLRDGELTLTPEVTGVLLELVDAVRSVLATVEAQGEEGDPDHSSLVERLTALQRPEGAPAVPGPDGTVPALEAAPVPAVEPAPAPGAAGGAGGVGAARDPEWAESPAPRLGDLLVDAGLVSVDDVTVAVLEQQAGDKRKLGEILVDHGRVNGAQVQAVLEAQTARRSVVDSTVRVDVNLLDDLMRLVGELVLTRNQIVQHAAGLADQDLTGATQRLSLVVRELQEGVMKTRMQPVDHVWSRLTRVVRDLGVTCGKQVRLEMQGRDTELDRTVLEAVKDPLTHLVRNSVDHGIEPPEARAAAGKPPEGLLLLRAYHEGGQVNIEITDDGAGIDPHAVAAKAVERGLVTAGELARMSEREMTSLVFLPGFSTATAVTNVSGRGVGLDVVRTNMEKIGGTVDVTSRPGWGTTFRVKIPLTLAIVPALTVRTAGDRYAIPQGSLVEVVPLDGADAGKAVEQVLGVPVLRLRGSLLPLVHLRTELGLEEEQGAERPACVVVLQADGRQFGLVVDEVLDTEEIVVKPLGAQLKSVPVYAGATILGDGRVALILDALALAQQAQVVDAARDRGPGEPPAEPGDVVAASEALLVVGLQDGRRVALPLAAVTRLEEFPLSQLERVGDRPVVQYRGQVLPLVDLSSYPDAGRSRSPQDSVQVVVCSERERSVGLVVDRILDIAQQVEAAESRLDDHGLPGSAVVQDQVTEVLDLRKAILAGDPSWCSPRKRDESGVPA